MTKMRTLLIVCLVVALSGCSGSKKLIGTTWFNLSVQEQDGIVGDVISAITFEKNDSVSTYLSIVVDTIVAAAPTKIAEGVYKYENGDVVKKNLPISFSMTNWGDNEVNYIGTFKSKNELDLKSTTDTAIVNYQRLTKKSLKKLSNKK